MAPAAGLLTFEEFQQRYGSEVGYEYWFGEVVQKPVPTWLHSIMQAQLAQLLDQIGYFSGSELTPHMSDEQRSPRTAANA